MDDKSANNRSPLSVKIGQACEIDTALPVTVVMRVYFSSYHLRAAKHLSELARNAENEEGRRPRFDIRHRAYVTNSIFSAVGFLEAVINELFQDVADGHESYISALGTDGKRQRSELWQAARGKNQRRGTLEKYQEALGCLGINQFDKNQPPYQDAALVRDLRNKLVHYQPKSLGGRIKHSLDSLLSGKFQDNKLMEGSGNPWFPDKCLGYGCAEWSVRAVSAFADEFFSRIGVVPNYQRVQFQPPPHAA